jgi:hypothetical protein
MKFKEIIQPFWVQTFSSAPCSQSLSICSFLDLRDQVSLPYKIEGKLDVGTIFIRKIMKTTEKSLTARSYK